MELPVNHFKRALRQELKRHVPRIHDPASVIGMGG